MIVDDATSFFAAHGLLLALLLVRNLFGRFTDV